MGVHRAGLPWRENEQVRGGQSQGSHAARNPTTKHLFLSPDLVTSKLAEVRKETKEMMRKVEQSPPPHLSPSPLEWQGRGSG